MYYSLVAIALGSILGGWSRWWVGLKLNNLHPSIPMGTVAVNLIGGFIIGFAIAFFAQSQLSQNYKLFVITGFCGGLTTFSTFSLEVVTLLQQGRISTAMLVISIHVIGALLCTMAGMAVFQWWHGA
ncbi:MULTISPECIES: fluoride efflux transporter CrcB [Acinetobacter]|uniref:Fluoride-specific ion channel FluC n=1 Tax=Acinetobacter pollinis TaxID=2605270 RepID=A0ABU6DTE9_9GAMM|nr:MULTISPECIES: fluoride efflux transporter CrcB [Acinetobacter]MCF9046831.1 fluoride efflux transporter CrcB [Acinetobacter nectaris]MEB5476980.1 fluoride efflux transporter CrcB [Acinetobacter pollinis]WEV49232.1 fluoride efflux transporter CrcB [Acinetobacter sp. ESL0695]